MRKKWHLRDHLPSELQDPRGTIHADKERVHKPLSSSQKRLQLSYHSPTLNFTNKEPRLKDHSELMTERATFELSLQTAESRGSQPCPPTNITWEVFKNNNAQAPLWAK